MKTCKKVGKAVQRRAVYCTDGNGTVIRRSKCQNVPVPTGSRECDNVDCKVEWITSRWTKVSGDDSYSNLSQLMSENKIFNTLVTIFYFRFFFKNILILFC